MPLSRVAWPLLKDVSDHVRAVPHTSMVQTRPNGVLVAQRDDGSRREGERESLPRDQCRALAT